MPELRKASPPAERGIKKGMFVEFPVDLIRQIKSFCAKTDVKIYVFLERAARNELKRTREAR